MPAPIGTASIAFGLVNVPVRIYPATQDHDIRFHLVHASDRGRIRYDYVCAACGRTVEYYDIDRAYESAGGHRVIVTDDILAKLPAAEKSEILVLQFVPTEQIDPILLHRSYYLEPAAATPRAYKLLAETLARTDRTAVVHFTLREKTRLGALRVRGSVLVLQSLLWPDEVRHVRFPSLEKQTPPDNAQLHAAQALAAALTDDFDPDNHVDEYQVELKRLLDEAIATGRSPATISVPPSEHDTEVDDLIVALQRAVADATVDDRTN